MIIAFICFRHLEFVQKNPDNLQGFAVLLSDKLTWAKTSKCRPISLKQAMHILSIAEAQTDDRPGVWTDVSKNCINGSMESECFSIHSASSPITFMLVYLTAIWTLVGRLSRTGRNWLTSSESLQTNEWMSE